MFQPGNSGRGFFQVILHQAPCVLGFHKKKHTCTRIAIGKTNCFSLQVECSNSGFFSGASYLSASASILHVYVVRNRLATGNGQRGTTLDLHWSEREWLSTTGLNQPNNHVLAVRSLLERKEV